MIKDPLKLLDELPCIAQQQEEAIEACFPRYAFYKNIGKNKVEYYCTGCHEWRVNSTTKRLHITQTNFKHNEKYTCPYCNNEIIAKAEGRGRKTLINKAFFAVYTAVKNKLYIRVCRAYQSFSDKNYDEANYYEPDYFYENCYLYVYERTAMQRFNIKWNADRGGWGFSPIRSDDSLPIPSWSNPDYSGCIGVTTDEVYKTDLKYSEVLNFSNSAYEQIAYLCKYVKHNNLEYIVKARFTSIADDVVFKRCDKNLINWKSNNLLKMLGIRKEDIENARHFNCKQLELYQKILKSEPNLKNIGTLTRTISRLGESRIQNIKELTHLSYKKILNYIHDEGTRLILWNDYLTMVAETPAGIQEVMPRNLRNAHDRILSEKEFFAKKDENKKIKKRVKELEPLLFGTDNLCMLIPTCGEEIVFEGVALHHCVGGYVQRHADGKTNILFIRRKSEPNTPFFTIEISSDLKIIQCHGYRNGRFNDKPPEVIEFEKQYEIFLEELKKCQN